MSYIKRLVSEKAFFIYIVSFMAVIPLSELVSEFCGFTGYLESYFFTVYGYAGLLLCCLSMVVNRKERHWSDFFFVSSLLFVLISLIFTVDRSPEGMNEEYPRYFLGYFCAMYAAFRISSPRYRNIVLGTFLSLALFQGTVAALQTFGIKILPVAIRTTTYEAYALTENTNFWGSLSVLFIGACAGAFVFCAERKLRIILGLLSLLVCYTSLCSMARLAWVGDVAAVMFLLASVLIMRRIRPIDRARYSGYLRRTGIFSLIFLAGAALVLINPNVRPLFLYRFALSGEELGSGDITDLGTSRVYTWSYALRAFPEHWLTGVGVGKFYHVFTDNPDWDGKYIFNQAHNVYLQILVTQGLPAFINYMALLVISAVKAVKKIISGPDRKETLLTWIFFAVFTGHLVSSFFSCRLYYVEFYFYIALGLMNAFSLKDSKKDPA